MKRLVLSLVIALSVIASIKGYSQNYVDLIRFKYGNTPLNQFDTTTASTRVEEYVLDATLPIVLNDKYAIITGFDLQNMRTAINPVAPELTSFYTILVKAGLNVNYGEKWSVNYIFLPKISSDLKDLSSKDFQYGAYVLAKFAKTENLKYQFGMYYNGELFGPFFVPLLGLYYVSPSNKLEINATLPVWADINYRFSNYFRLGMSFSAFVRSYNINEVQYSENGEYLVKSTNEPMLYLQFEPVKSIILQAKIGYSIGRSYRIYDEADRITFGLSAFRFGDDRTQLNSDFKDGMLFEGRLFYRFHIKDKE